MTPLARLTGAWRLRATLLSGQVRHVGWTTRALALAILIALIVGLALGFGVKAASRGSQEPTVGGAHALLTSPNGQVPAPLSQPADPLPPHSSGPVAAPARPAPVRPSGGQGRWHTIFATWYGPSLYGQHTADGSLLTPASVWVAMNGVPLGSRIEVRYRGVTLTLVVRDRHGKAARDFIDLTELAAARLGHRFSGNIEWRLP